MSLKMIQDTDMRLDNLTQIDAALVRLYERLYNETSEENRDGLEDIHAQYTAARNLIQDWILYEVQETYDSEIT